MSRRTVILATVVAFAGCQGTNSSMNSAFKMPTPSFNLLAPYGSPRVPPPGTHSYGQAGSIVPASARTPQPYYPGTTNVRGVALPQSPEGSASPPASVPASQGKVATAEWKSVRSTSGGDDDAEATGGEGTLVSHVAIGSHEATVAGEPPIRIPEVAVQPAEPATLVLGGMHAHDLTRAVAHEPRYGVVAENVSPAAVAVLASVPMPAPVARQVIYTAPVVTQPPVPVPASAPRGLVEITDLPQASAATPTPSLQRVRGFEPSPGSGAVREAAPANFIAPQTTISASAARETRDAVAAAAVQPAEPTVKPVSSPPAAAGWKSRYSMDES